MFKTPAPLFLHSDSQSDFLLFRHNLFGRFQPGDAKIPPLAKSINDDKLLSFVLSILSSVLPSTPKTRARLKRVSPIQITISEDPSLQTTHSTTRHSLVHTLAHTHATCDRLTEGTQCRTQRKHYASHARFFSSSAFSSSSTSGFYHQLEHRFGGRSLLTDEASLPRDRSNVRNKRLRPPPSEVSV